VEVGRDVDLEPPVAEGVVPENDSTLQGFGDRDVVVEAQDAWIGGPEDPHGALVRMEVVVSSQIMILAFGGAASGTKWLAAGR
jgi:hypothetical protein